MLSLIGSSCVRLILEGTIISDKPVWVKATGTVVDGQKLEVRDSGNVIRFTGGVRMVVQPDQLNAQTGER